MAVTVGIVCTMPRGVVRTGRERMVSDVVGIKRNLNNVVPVRLYPGHVLLSPTT